LIDYAQARELANKVLSDFPVPEGVGSFVLLESVTLERPLGWVFFYSCTIGPELLAGNSPFMIDRQNGHVNFLGTALPVDESLPKLEKELAAELDQISRNAT